MNRKILVVEDDIVQAATRRAVLATTGRSVLIAKSPLEALDLIRNPAILPEIGLIITDHLMPNMNGPQFVRAVRQISSALPVLVLSGFPEAEHEYQELNVLYRSKPYPPSELLLLTTSLLNKLPLGKTA